MLLVVVLGVVVIHTPEVCQGTLETQARWQLMTTDPDPTNTLGSQPKGSYGKIGFSYQMDPMEKKRLVNQKIQGQQHPF